MQFRKLRLTGFKSFVDPTELVFGDGLTGIVGPNGCGKSNLLEALRWVMGESRPKAVRGSGMEDVIFAGAFSRPARNFAEVSLFVDGFDRRVTADFGDCDELEIMRRVTRDLGSAYRINSRDMRARDVQMLFADGSTGAHSPALVRQGRVSEVINAKPIARRRILEEAAGISGLYQRRHEAELKLNGAEANLARVNDILEQLEGQLQHLARQARQAVRYREIGRALRRAEGMLLYHRWREAEEVRVATEAELRKRVSVEAGAGAAVREAAKAREVAESVLPARRGDHASAGAALQRIRLQCDALSDRETQARQRIVTLTARLGQLGRDIEREVALNSDADEMITRLEREERELSEAGSGHDERLATAARAASEMAGELEVKESEFARLTEDLARLSARHQSGQRLLEDSQKLLERSETEVEKACAAAASARAELERAEAGRETAQAAEVAARKRIQLAETGLARAEGVWREAQSAEARARSTLSEANGEARVARAEVAALARLVARDSSCEERILDRIKVTPGFEKALGAVFSDELNAPLVDSGDSSGWLTLPDYDDISPLPAGVEPLATEVQAPSALARLLSRIGVTDRATGSAAQAQLRPGQCLVTRDGDLWRWDGFRSWAEDVPSAIAVRLEQVNRLTGLRSDLEAMDARSTALQERHDALRDDLDAAVTGGERARTARRQADQDLAEASRASSQADAECTMAQGKLEAVVLAEARHREEADTARTQVSEAEKMLAALDDLEVARGRMEEIRLTVEGARARMISSRSAHDELRREGEVRQRRVRQIQLEHGSWCDRRDSAERRLAELGTIRKTVEQELEQSRTVPDALVLERGQMGRAIQDAEARLAEATDALSVAERVLREAVHTERDAERHAGEAREARARAEARVDAARETVTAAGNRIMEELDLSPLEVLERLELNPDDIANPEELEAEVRRHRQQRENLGAVNLRAEEDAREIRIEHETLAGEKVDLEEAVRVLRNSITSLNREGRERLLTAFEQVNENFSMLFTRLFGGGEARLLMVENDDPLEAGLEIMCQPPGKKLSTLSLLSGGEQTMTAIALIFAVFLANPAPICVLDEVDAPLDSVNVARFCDLLDQMCAQTPTRFLVITHHAITMSRMDRLFGVTMAEKGVSQLVSVDLKKAEALAA